jgi:hypothetical protein
MNSARRAPSTAGLREKGPNIERVVVGTAQSLSVTSSGPFAMGTYVRKDTSTGESSATTPGGRSHRAQRAAEAGGPVASATRNTTRSAEGRWDAPSHSHPRASVGAVGPASVAEGDGKRDCVWWSSMFVIEPFAPPGPP